MSNFFELTGMKGGNSDGCDYLVFDISNLLYRSFYANQSGDELTQAGMAHHIGLTTLNKYFKIFKPRKKVIMTFDRSNWRKAYTQDESVRYTDRLYKGQRRKDMTPSQKEKYLHFMEHLKEFEEIMRVHTSVVCLAEDGLEADDLMAGMAQQFSEDDDVVLVSADKDLIQLLRFDKVRLIDPMDGKDRTLDEWDGDADLFMFEKCLRGDQGDNVMSAYPRIRSTKIRDAWDDPYLCANIMNHRWTDQNNREMLVKRAFNENKLLMDLSCQPECVKRKIDDTIKNGLEDPGHFDYFQFLKFCGKFELKRISEKLENYVPMLSK